MATKPQLIFCANGNKRFASIAIEHGFLYGAQLPGTVYFPPMFVDQNWKNPDRAKYMSALAEHRPYMASVIDWEWRDQLPEVLSWAEEAAAFVDIVMIIPKVTGHVGYGLPPCRVCRIPCSSIRGQSTSSIEMVQPYTKRP